MQPVEDDVSLMNPWETWAMESLTLWEFGKANIEHVRNAQGIRHLSALCIQDESDRLSPPLHTGQALVVRSWKEAGGWATTGIGSQDGGVHWLVLRFSLAVFVSLRTFRA